MYWSDSCLTSSQIAETYLNLSGTNADRDMDISPYNLNVGIITSTKDSTTNIATIKTINSGLAGVVVDRAGGSSGHFATGTASGFRFAYADDAGGGKFSIFRGAKADVNTGSSNGLTQVLDVDSNGDFDFLNQKISFGSGDTAMYSPSSANRLNMESIGSMVFAIDTDNDSTSNTFTWYTNANDTNGDLLMTLDDDGTLTLEGTTKTQLLGVGTATTTPSTAFPLYIHIRDTGRPSIFQKYSYTGAGSGGLAVSLNKINIENVDNSSDIEFYGFGWYGARGNPPSSKYVFMDARDGGQYNKATLKVDSEDRVGIALSGTTRPSYPLEVSTNVSEISIYAHSNISATGFITRTSNYDKSLGSALDLIKDADDYFEKDELGASTSLINHSAFYGYSKWEVQDYSRPVLVTPEIVNETTGELIEPASYDYPYNKTEEGVDLGKEIDVLRQSVYELKTQNEEMSKELCYSSFVNWVICWMEARE